MPITEYDTLSAVSVGTSELSVISGTTSLQEVTDDGAYQLWLDPVGAALVKGDAFRFRVYEKVLAGSTKRVALQGTLSHVQSQHVVLPPVLLMHGWDMTLQKLAGTDRPWSASVRQASGPGLTEYDSMSAVTVTSSELSVISGTTSLQAVTDVGSYQFWFDASNLAKGDEYVVRVYEKVLSGGTKRVVWDATLTDVQARLLVTPQLLLVNGWDATVQKVTGTDRAWDASVRRVV